MTTLVVFVVAAISEIFGCYAFWLWLREGRSRWWIPVAIVSLSLFGLALTRADTAFAGRAFAAYGGVYITASLMWLWQVERRAPDWWDLVGAILCLTGAALILFGPRGAPR